MREKRSGDAKLPLWKLSIIISALLLPMSASTLAASHSKSPLSPGDTDHAPQSNEHNLHLLERLSFGPRPGDLDYLNRVGSERFIREQLNPQSLPEPSELKNRLYAFSTLRQSSPTLIHHYLPLLRQLRELQKAQKASTRSEGSANEKASASVADDTHVDLDQLKTVRLQVKQPYFEASQARLFRALQSPRQLQEVMTDFWYNHFNIFSEKELDRFLISAYEEQAIRPYALGRFRDLLGATAHHPAMMIYLDNWENTDPNSPGVKGRFKGLNENYARELMELHTLGVDNGYTQKDVITLAKILTGWGVVPTGKMLRQTISGSGFFFDINRHDTSNKVFLGKTIRGGGIDEGEKALDILAKHPATAHHISFQLAQAFVSDTPSGSLVDALSKEYLASDGNIAAVLNTLFHRPEFWDSRNDGNKFKSPYRYVLSSIRASGIEVQNVFPLIATLQQMGMPLYGCLTPDGYKNTTEAWMSPDALTRRLNFATLFSRSSLGLSQAPPDFLTMGEGVPLKQAMKQAAQQGEAIDAMTVQSAYGKQFKAKTMDTVLNAPIALKAALLLGSPERMYY